MATNLSGNTLTLGSYALTASQSGNVCVGKVEYILAGSSIEVNKPLSTLAYIISNGWKVTLMGSWSGIESAGMKGFRGVQNTTVVKDSDTESYLIRVS